MNAYQRTAALKAAIELDLFSAVGDGATAKELAARCHASETWRADSFRLPDDHRLHDEDGGRPLPADSRHRSASWCDVPGLSGWRVSISRHAGVWSVNPTSSRPPFAAERSTRRRSTVAPDNPIWVEFARSMRPLVGPAADMIAEALDVSSAAADEGARHCRRTRCFWDRDRSAESQGADRRG